MKTPRVSIIMPVYNCGEFVVQAVDSIRRQSFGDWELLIVDDGSSDDTVDRLRSVVDKRVVVIEGVQNRGLPARLNQLVDRAQGSVIARMDGDDIAHPDRLTRQLHFLDHNPDVDLVACGMVVTDRDGHVVGLNRQRKCAHEQIVRTPWSGFHMNHATWVGKADWFRQFRYNEKALLTEDDELLLRAYRDSRFARLPDTLYAYRVTTLDLSKILKTRWSHCKWLVHHSIQQRNGLLLLGIPLHALKAVVDVFALATGLRFRVLRHRAGGVPARLANFWNLLLERYRTGPRLSV